MPRKGSSVNASNRGTDSSRSSFGALSGRTWRTPNSAPTNRSCSTIAVSSETKPAENTTSAAQADFSTSEAAIRRLAP